MNTIRKIIRKEVETILLEKKKKKEAVFSPILRRGFSFFNINSDYIEEPSDINFGGIEEQKLNEQTKKTIETLNFFDFDGTLMNTPKPEAGKKMYADITGEDYPYINWWSKKESLEPFNIKTFPNVVSLYNQRKNEPYSLTMLLTNRVKELENVVKNILDNNQLYFDDYNFKVDGKEKIDRVKEYIKKYPSVKNINIYDDRDKEISMFKELKKELEDKGIYVNIFQIKK